MMVRAFEQVYQEVLAEKGIYTPCSRPVSP